MADRVTKITLRGEISDFKAKMVAAGKSVSAATDKMTAAEKQSVKFRQGLTSVGDAAGKMGLVAAAGLAAILASSANFDSSMSKVQAATHDSAMEMEKLRAAAIKAGADTVFSATEAADAITAMSKAGVSTNDILTGGLNGALALASAGELDVAQSADIAATAMNQFGLKGKDIPHIADLLAAGAGKAQGEVTDMATALKYVGPVAHQMGISIEQTTGTIAELASQGILADQAGTSLRGMLTALTSPSKQAAKEMKSLGINLYDAQGKFVGFSGVAAQLHTTMSGLTNAERDQALGRIFGNEQITAARILYSGGAADVDKWTKAVNDQGYAAETAATKMNNLKGDLEQLRGSLETAFIGAGAQAQGPLRAMTQGLTGVVNAFTKLPPATQSTATAMLAITAITGGGLWFGTRVVKGIADTRSALDQLGVSSSKVGGALKGLAAAGAGLAALEVGYAAIGQLNKALDEALPGTQELTGQLIRLSKVGPGVELGAQFNDLASAVDRISNGRWDDKLESVVTLGNLQAKSLREAKAEVGALDTALAGLVTSGSPEMAATAFSNMTKSLHLDAGQVYQLGKLLPQYSDALAGAANQSGLAAGAADAHANATGRSTDAIEINRKAIAKEVDALHKIRDAQLANSNARLAYKQAILDTEQALKDNGKTLDENTDKGLANRRALNDLISAWNAQSDAVKNGKGARKEAIDQFVALATKMSMNSDKARAYAKRLLDIPSKVTTRMEIDKAKAEADLKKFSQEFHGYDGDTITNKVKIQFERLGLTGTGYGAPGAYPTTKPKKKATGGLISGPGTGTSDSIPAYLSNGEFVVNAKATAANRSLLEAINSNAQQIQAQSRHHYANGGYVSGGPEIDYDRLAAAMSRVRPMYGDVHVHGDNSFRREAKSDAIRQGGGGVNF